MRSDYRLIDAPIGGAGHLSASQQGGIFGVSKFQTPFSVAQVYLHGSQVEQTEAMEMGHVLEDVVARYYASKLGVHIKRSNLAWCRKDRPWLVCHPDRLVVEPVNGKRIALEIKTASTWGKNDWGDEGTDEVPYPYLLQCQCYFVCGVDYGRLDEVHVVRLMDNKIRAFVVKRDEELIQAILKKNDEFHEMLESGKLPEPSTPVEFTAQYPHSVEESVTATSEVEEAVEKHKQLDAQIKELKSQLEEADMIIKNALQEKSYLLSSDGATLATFKEQNRTSIDSKLVKALLSKEQLAEVTKITTSRTLRIK